MRPILIACILFLVACGGAAPSPTPQPSPTTAPTATAIPPTATAIPPTPRVISALFKTQAVRYLELGATLTAATKKGITYAPFVDQTATLAGTLQLMKDTGGDSFTKSTRENTEKAEKGWTLARTLWKMQIDKAPLLNDYDKGPLWNSYLDYLGNDAVKRQAPGASYNVLPYDENISVLLTISARYFEAAKSELIELLK